MRRDETWMPSANESAELAEAIGVDWEEVPFDAARFHVALTAEVRAAEEPDPAACARLALARLTADPDHYGADPGPET
jgi:hypothetical protein